MASLAAPISSQESPAAHLSGKPGLHIRSTARRKVHLDVNFPLVRWDASDGMIGRLAVGRATGDVGTGGTCSNFDGKGEDHRFVALGR